MRIINKEKKWCVYIHIAPNNKKYIGITCRHPEDRWRDGKGYFYNQHFTNAINKYGWENFYHDILFDNINTIEEACRLEQICIALFKTNNSNFGYNKTPGGLCGEKKNSDGDNNRVLKKVYCFETGKVYNNATIAGKDLGFINKQCGHNILNACREHKSYNDYHFCFAEDLDKIKLSDIKNKRKYSEERKQEAKELFKKKKLNGDFKEIYCFELNKFFPCASIASEELNIPSNKIRSILCGIQKTTRGLHFCYSDEIDKYNKKNFFNEKYRRIYCFETKEFYESAAEAARQVLNKKDNSGIIRNCKKQQKSCCGYHFCYAENLEKEGD